MDRFSKFHPAVCLLFFIFVICTTLLFMNPVYSAVSFICALLYALRLSGKRRTAAQLRFALPLVVLSALFNMLFCRYGSTVLFSVFGIDFSLEPLAYGACIGLMLAAAVIWFFSYSEIVTSEKFTALFGRSAPNIVLIFSTALRFLPLMVKTAAELKEAQQGLGNETKGLKNTMARFSALVSISLEQSIETADTMRARGFKKGRRQYSPYAFRAADGVLIFVCTALFAAQIAALALGVFEFEYYEELRILNMQPAFPAAWAALCLIPLITDLPEEVKWRLLRSKI